MNGCAYVWVPGLGYLGIDAKAQATIEASRNAGRIVSASGGGIYVPGTGDCADAQARPQVDITTMTGGLALEGINVAAAAGAFGAGAAAVLGPVTMGISSIIGLFGALHAHHAAAVRREQTVLCSAVPAANNYLDIIDKAVAQGAATADQAVSALDSLNSDFHAQLQSIYKDCNAACVMGMVADAAVGTQKAKYQALAAEEAAAQATADAAQAGPADGSVFAPTRPNTASVPALPYVGPASPGIPDWMKYAAAGLAAYLLMEAL